MFELNAFPRWCTRDDWRAAIRKWRSGECTGWFTFDVLSGRVVLHADEKQVLRYAYHRLIEGGLVYIYPELD
jgi:hypothetical protein